MMRSELSVTASTFVEVMLNTRHGALLRLTGWKTYMNELYYLTPAKKVWTNPRIQKKLAPV